MKVFKIDLSPSTSIIPKPEQSEDTEDIEEKGKKVKDEKEVFVWKMEKMILKSLYTIASQIQSKIPDYTICCEGKKTAEAIKEDQEVIICSPAEMKFLKQGFAKITEVFNSGKGEPLPVVWGYCIDLWQQLADPKASDIN